MEVESSGTCYIIIDQGCNAASCPVAQSFFKSCMPPSIHPIRLEYAAISIEFRSTTEGVCARMRLNSISARLVFLVRWLSCAILTAAIFIRFGVQVPPLVRDTYTNEKFVLWKCR